MEGEYSAVVQELEIEKAIEIGFAHPISECVRDPIPVEEISADFLLIQRAVKRKTVALDRYGWADDNPAGKRVHRHLRV